ncbi:hypothetical protein [Amnibacterium endophyticum]|uniref:Chemotaxis protein n=1 Tax=Amnibacterium endophyticum TaxID=2109337 RepID=A0ABW4LEL7_9MICO
MSDQHDHATDPTATPRDGSPDYAPPSDLPLPGDHEAHGGGAHRADGPAVAAGRTDDGDSVTSTYSDAPEVAQRSAADDGRDEGATRSDAAQAPGATAPDGSPFEKGDPRDLNDPGHVFDQTNGMVDALDGDSDGLAGSDEHSAAEKTTTES